MSSAGTELLEDLVGKLGQRQGPTLKAPQHHYPELDLKQLWPTASRLRCARKTRDQIMDRACSSCSTVSTDREVPATGKVEMV